MRKLFLILTLAVIAATFSFPQFAETQTRPSFLQLKDRPQIDARDYGVIPGIDVSVQLQAAIDAAGVTKKTLILAPGSYIVSTTLTTTEQSFSMIGDESYSRGGGGDPFPYLSGTVIEWTGSTTAPVLRYNTGVSQHGVLKNISFVMPATHVGNTLEILGCPFGGPTTITASNLGFYHRGVSTCHTSSSTAILMRTSGVDNANPVLWGNTLKDIYFFGYGMCLRLEVDDLGENFINGNYFTNILAYQCWRLLHLSADTGTNFSRQISFNVFDNMQIQSAQYPSGTTALNILDSTGANYFANTFRDLKLWDYAVNAPVNPFYYVICKFDSAEEEIISSPGGAVVYNDPNHKAFQWFRGNIPNIFRINAPTDPTDDQMVFMSHNWNGSALDSGAFASAVLLRAGYTNGAVSLCTASGTASMSARLTVDHEGRIIFAKAASSTPLLSTSPAGTFFVHGVSGALYYSDGNNWTQIAP